MTFNLPTLLLALVVVFLAVLAIHRMTHRGLCDCHDHCGDSSSDGSGCGGCQGCSAAEKMIADMNKTLDSQSKG